MSLHKKIGKPRRDQNEQDVHEKQQAQLPPGHLKSRSR